MVPGGTADDGVPNGSGERGAMVMPFGRMLGVLRRVIAGLLLIVAGFWLSAQAASAAQGGTLLALVLLTLWGGAGVGAMIGHPWGRLGGLGVAALGIVIGLILGAVGTDSALAPMLFSPADAQRWYVVQPVGYGLAVVSGLIGLLLLLPFRPEAQGSPGSDPDSPR